jgi:hypothetical protein
MRKMRVSADDYYRVVEPIIEEFFVRGCDRVFQPRLQREHDTIQETHNARSKAGKKGVAVKRALKTNNKPPSPADDLLKQPEQELKPDIYKRVITFEEFWKESTKRGLKRQAEKAFTAAIKRGDVEIILSEMQKAKAEHIPKTPEQQKFTPHVSTWLNGDGWVTERNDIDPVKVIAWHAENIIKAGPMASMVTSSAIAKECVEAELVTREQCKAAGIEI